MVDDAGSESQRRDAREHVVDVLAVDVGATSIKSAPVSRDGEVVAARARRATPHPCTPERLVEVIKFRVAQHRPEHVAVGFPGEVRDGVVLDGANLARHGAPTAPLDDELDRQWRGCDLRDLIEGATGCPTIVMNDAAMTALGCVDDRGTDLVVALGTGFGVAVTQNGRLVDVPDYGTLTLEGDDSYDVLLGEAARSRDMDAWTSRVIDVVAQLARKHDADVVHLAGGNARRLSERHFDAQDVPVRIDRGDPAIRGAWVAWRQ